MGGCLFLHGNSNVTLDAASIIVRDTMNPRIDLLLENVKSMCHRYPAGSPVVSTHGPLGILVAPAISETGHRSENGASFFGKDSGTVLCPLLIMD